MEAGIVGYSCAEPLAADDMHLLSDAYALTQRTRTVGDAGLEVDAFLFTPLLPSAAKIMVNVESGDFGRVARRRCGCGIEAVGLDTHVSYIRSFEKLTGEGMAFVQTDLAPILEQALPTRFGGTAADYQLVEEEGEHGIPRLLLLVSPEVGPIDHEQVRESFLEQLGGQDGLDRLSAATWQRAGTVEVRRERPLATRAGKILPFHLVRR
jgi:hypothetical protein